MKQNVLVLCMQRPTQFVDFCLHLRGEAAKGGLDIPAIDWEPGNGIITELAMTLVGPSHVIDQFMQALVNTLGPAQGFTLDDAAPIPEGDTCGFDENEEPDPFDGIDYDNMN